MAPCGRPSFFPHFEFISVIQLSYVHMMWCCCLFSQPRITTRRKRGWMQEWRKKLWSSAGRPGRCQSFVPHNKQTRPTFICRMLTRLIAMPFNRVLLWQALLERSSSPHDEGWHPTTGIHTSKKEPRIVCAPMTTRQIQFFVVRCWTIVVIQFHGRVGIILVWRQLQT